MPSAGRTLLLFVAICLACATGKSSAPGKRPIDVEPRRSVGRPPLAAGQAEAFFSLNTGADQGSAEKEAGLEAVVRFADVELRQTIASCRTPSLGSALGGGTAELLEVAYCDAELWLETKNGTVFVTRHMPGEKAAQIARFVLPPGVFRATRPRE